MTGQSGQSGQPGRPASRQVPAASEVLGFALVFGLGTGLLEVVLRGVQKYVFGGYLFDTRDMVWMAPLADAGVFLLAGFGLLAVRGLLGLIRPGRPHVGYATMFATYVAMIPLGPLLTTWRIHKLVIYAAAALLVMALLWYYYLGE